MSVIPAKAGIQMSFQPRIKCGVNSSWNPDFMNSYYVCTILASKRNLDPSFRWGDSRQTPAE
ncbi:MAG: hypothetical protein HY602_02215 [Parcubacteria group bacterium]|nr:hypothetical protein [Parcubacteria group bacterium]